MKKTLCALLCLLMLAAAFSPAAFAVEENFDTLVGWNIRVPVPEDTVAGLAGDEYYIYTREPGSIPYVMLRVYAYDSAEEFLKDFTAYMQEQYADLTVTSEATARTIGDKDCLEIDYSYTVSGYNVRDRRIAVTRGDTTYLFASKEIDKLDMVIGDLLEQVVANSVFLDAGPSLPEVPMPLMACCYNLPDGMPKYWLDFSGLLVDNVVLHCYFRSGDPSFYERLFILDMASAELDGNDILIHKVADEAENDCSAWFEKLVLHMERDSVTMEVRRDASTLAGGAEDNILDGEYRMERSGIGIIYRHLGEDGAVKYWLDPYDDRDYVLHCHFISDNPEGYEELFYLDPAAFEPLEKEFSYRVGKIKNAYGEDVSAWFKTLTLTWTEDGVVLDIERDESTLAGGAGDNLLSGSYFFAPHTYLLPESRGPYTAEELAYWAQVHYFRVTGFFPPEAEVEENADGSFTIHLYEVVELDGVKHTATSAWYKVDEYGVGRDEITEQPIDLQN